MPLPIKKSGNHFSLTLPNSLYTQQSLNNAVSTNNISFKISKITESHTSIILKTTFLNDVLEFCNYILSKNR